MTPFPPPFTQPTPISSSFFFLAIFFFSPIAAEWVSSPFFFLFSFRFSPSPLHFNEVRERGKLYIYISIFYIEGGDAGRYLVRVSWVAGLTTRGRLVAVEDPEMAVPMA
jgi:hypothetical protein